MSLQVSAKMPIRSNISLRELTTLKIGGPARYLAEPQTQEDLSHFLQMAKQEHIPWFIIGRGSNLLVSDQGFDGMVISLRKMDVDAFRREGSDTVRAAAGMNLFRFVSICTENGLAGSEFLCHVPGTVGGAVRMNAGFGRPDDRWQEVKDILESVTVMNENGEVSSISAKDIHFAYRSCSLDPQLIILDAVLRLVSEDKFKIAERVKKNFEYRNSVQDLRYPSAGSYFKNVKDAPMSTGRMLDLAGMKGCRQGGAMISDKHANFFVNAGGATAHDVLGLQRLAQNRVLEKFGVHIEPEVRFIGKEI